MRNAAVHDQAHDGTMPAGLRARFASLPGDSIADALRIERGSMDDYRPLAAFHYQGGRPGAVTCVFRLVHDAPSVIGRYVQRRSEHQTVGVLVRSLPQPNCHLRDLATNGRYAGLDRSARARLVNCEIRTISRVIVHPQWRGLGLAVRLVRYALNRPETPYTEALAAMGRVHPFFQRAGMTTYDRPPSAAHARLLDALEHIGLPAAHLASRRVRCARLRQCTQAQRTWLFRELKRWYRAAFHTPASNMRQFTMDHLLDAARDRVLLQPVYYLTRHDRTGWSGDEDSTRLC